MKDLYVISDVHGRDVQLVQALMETRIYNSYGVKKRDAFVIQIGDLINGVDTSVEGDLVCLSMVGKEIDLLLVGNHEMPYFEPRNRFSGFHFNHEISEKLHELNDHGLLGIGYCHNDILITHAGVTRQKLPVLVRSNVQAKNVLKKLEQEWGNKNYGWHLFHDCGKVRGGQAAIGGMLWCDFDHEFEPTEFSQVVGHTPGILRMKGNAICIDTEGKPTILRLGV